MSARSQVSVLSLEKISLSKLKQGNNSACNRFAHKMSQNEPALSTDVQPFEDSPPSYTSTLSEDVDEMSTKEFVQDCNTITSQPCSNSNESLELSTRSSLQSTKMSVDTQLLNTPVKRPLNNAWNEKVVIQNIHKRDQTRLLCFCASVLSGIAALAFFCTQ